jgi:hypothetical protein
MLIIDKFRRRESKDRPLFLRVDAEDADSRKIIDFESARQAFERDDATNRRGKQLKRTFLNDFRTDRSAGVAESLITIVLVLVIGLSLLLGMLWGF